jgi:hypothetical protein
MLRECQDMSVPERVMRPRYGTVTEEDRWLVTSGPQHFRPLLTDLCRELVRGVEKSLALRIRGQFTCGQSSFVVLPVCISASLSVQCLMHVLRYKGPRFLDLCTLGESHRYPLHRRCMAGARARLKDMEKWTFSTQPVANRYTDLATPIISDNNNNKRN